MPTKIIVNGAHGKMGGLACETINNHHDFELVGRLTRQDNLGLAITSTKADIVIDLTNADCVYHNSLTIIKHGAHPVIGSSGLLPHEIQQLISLCEKQQLGGIICANFSISAALMISFTKQAARFLPEVEIIEAHHQEKLDAPSGTALKTAEMIAQARAANKKNLPLHETIPGARGASHYGTNIHSLRLPGFIAQQQVIFGSTGETLTISHNSINRESFMPGIILSCQKVQQLNHMYCGLEYLLD